MDRSLVWLRAALVNPRLTFVVILLAFQLWLRSRRPNLRPPTASEADNGQRLLAIAVIVGLLIVLATSASVAGATVQSRVVGCLAWLLPDPERARFVAEERGNLGGLRWWERVDYLVGLTIGMPRLAWMMRRNGRRRRAGAMTRWWL
jgi:hypothetical protein